MSDSRVDDSERKVYYGSGRQPWDVMVGETPWAPYFAAGCILRYLRRPDKCPVSDQWLSDYTDLEYDSDNGAGGRQALIDEQRKHSLDSARWYYRQLRKMSSSHGRHPMYNLASKALLILEDKLLTVDERKLLEDK